MIAFDGARRKRRSTKRKASGAKGRFKAAAKACKGKKIKAFRACMRAKLKTKRSSGPKRRWFEKQ